MKVELGMSLEMGDALTEVDGRAADGAMYLIALLYKELGQKRTILTGDASD